MDLDYGSELGGQRRLRVGAFKQVRRALAEYASRFSHDATHTGIVSRLWRATHAGGLIAHLDRRLR